jgi:hypothetical protein
LPVRRFLSMKRQIPRIKAQTALEMVNVTIIPHLTQEGRQKVLDTLNDAAYPYRKEKVEPWWKNPPKGLQLVTTGEANKIISGR